MHRELTPRDLILAWFDKERHGKVTSYITVCRRFALMRDLRGELRSLVENGHLKKLKKGFRKPINENRSRS